ncbi:MAG TPA: ATP-binding protein, partial [Ktedonobacteraceae bacterium]|nr:ATP-binding protein [Ktedonobacteraceae bacterium]
NTFNSIPLLILPVICGYTLIRHQFLGTTSLLSRQVMRALLWILLGSFFVIPSVNIMHILENNVPGLGENRYYFYAGLLWLSMLLFPLFWGKVRNFGDQVFYHDFYEYNRSLRELSAELTRLQHLDQICTFVLPHLAQLLNARGAALLVYAGDNKEKAGSDSLAEEPWRIYRNADFLPAERLTRIADLALTHQLQRSAEPLLLDGVLLLALYDGEQLRGFLCLGPKLNFEPYSRQDKSFLTTLAAQLSVLEANTRYLEQAEADAHQLTALNRRVISAQEDERRHLALELHDDVLQQAMLLVRQLSDASSMTEVADAMPLARSLVTGLRRTCLELRPPLLDELGLEEALDWLAQQTEQRAAAFGSLHVQVSCVNTAHIRLPADVELAFYRVAQEALANVLKHAQASQVCIRLRYHTGGEMSLLVCDNGRGFARGQMTSERLGLVGMHERLAAVGGRLQMRATPGRGVIIRATYTTAKPAIDYGEAREQVAR